MVDYSTLSIVFTGVSISLAAFYYISTLRNTEKSRKRELILQRHQSYNLDYTRTFWELASWTDWKTVEEFKEKYGMPSNPEAKAKFTYIMRILSTAGTLLKENMANADLIFELYPATGVIGLWEQFEMVIMDIREKRNSPSHLSGFEFLYREAKKRHPDILPLSHEWK